MNLIRALLLPVAVAAAFLLTGCRSEPASEKNDGPVDLLNQRAVFEIDSLPRRHPAGMPVHFVVRQTDAAQTFDSVIVRVNGKKAGRGTGSFSWETRSALCGTQNIQVSAYRKGKEEQTATSSFYLRAPEAPVVYRYEVVARYPHSPASYTQGLVWHGNRLYEGTGLNGKSAIMEIDLKSGRDIKKTALGQEFFGEGITTEGARLYQITWQNRKGFIYSLPDLKKTGDFSYPTEGWGLTGCNGNLVMSDGTNRLYFLDKTGFANQKTLEVWDHKNPVEYLNELEYAGGLIWANKYQTDTLAAINPSDGRVAGYLDLRGILPESDRTGEEDVLNGIAYRADEDLFYVTGKNWPYLFAIRIRKEKPRT